MHVDHARGVDGSLWFPASPCGAGCLPDPRTLPRVGALRAACRLAGVAAVLLVGLVAAFLPLGVARRRGLLRLVIRGVLGALGIRHRIAGRVAPYGALLASSHVSWLDPLVLLASLPARLVAKREVAGWPVIGLLVARAGTVFIDRGRPRELPACVAAVAALLRQGEPVVVYPEGTTWCGRAAGPFRPAFFQAAVATRAPVQPVSLEFRVAGRPSAVAAFVGDDTLVRSLWRVLTVRGLDVTARLHPPVYPGATGGRQHLARIATERIAKAAPPAHRHAR